MDKIKTKSDIVKEFIYSIQSKKSKGLPYYQIYIDKELFELTYNFNLKDWKNIRTKEYWLQNSLIFSEQKSRKTLCGKKLKYALHQGDERTVRHRYKMCSKCLSVKS
jgi:hypothetical protein